MSRLGHSGLCLLLAILPLSAMAATERVSAPESVLAVAPSLFLVVARDGLKDVVVGTAVTVQPGYLVTNLHQVESVLSLSVRQGDKTWIASRAVADRKWNLAILHAPGLDAPAVEIADSASLRPGEQVYGLVPGRQGVTLAPAQIAAVETIEGQRVLELRAAQSHRLSGGGLFDPRGKLIGITAFYLEDGRDLARAMPGEFIAAWLRRMRPVR